MLAGFQQRTAQKRFLVCAFEFVAIHSHQLHFHQFANNSATSYRPLYIHNEHAQTCFSTFNSSVLRVLLLFTLLTILICNKLLLHTRLVRNTGDAFISNLLTIYNQCLNKHQRQPEEQISIERMLFVEPLKNGQIFNLYRNLNPSYTQFFNLICLTVDFV